MKNRKGDQIDQMFEARKYSDAELQDFHNKIQRFWSEPRDVVFPETPSMNGVARKFDYQALAVAFGACKKVQHRARKEIINDEEVRIPLYVYLYNDRSKDLVNLWGQYEDWRKKRDWIEDKQTEELQKLANEVPF